jgi:LAGLIDADG DNA endonuclease family
MLHVKSTKGIKRLSKEERNLINIQQEVKDILVGVMLSDGHISRRSTTSNPRFIFNQSGKKEKRTYFELVYKTFKPFCSIDFNPYIIEWNDKKIGKEYSSINFATLQLPCFIEPYFIWYKKGKKRVPANIIDILTPVGLAHWIMGDGSKQNLGLHLSVYAFTKEDVNLLIEALEFKFGLKCSIHNLSSIGDKPSIYIWKDSMPLLKGIVGKYILPEMKYKLNE